ncbi:MAG: hypothetical protein JXA30_21990 [Deltaproteobacteria bacterium]|nr:hypothetical protein [Deltaproteobacteria bacterium]
MKHCFAEDLAFLQKYTDVVLLKTDPPRAQVAVAPEYQGRVMTSTASGAEGLSFGWINREVIASRKYQPHMNVFGGEDRFWLGPEGGQYSIYFKPNDPFDLEHWQVPAVIDWGRWQVVSRNDAQVRLRADANLTNYSGAAFNLRIDRTVRLISRETLERMLLMQETTDLDIVGYESINTITNTGDQAWTKDRGLLSIWILGMYNPSPRATVVIPFESGSEAEKGPIVNDDYFGKIPRDRLVVADRVLFFRADGKQRGKIGIPRPRAKDTIGSYDAAHRVLTIVQYSLPPGAADYVNSMWKIQAEPYNGDVVNSYNDGPPEKGAKALGGFYELETSSPAAELAPGEQLNHVHRTVHVQGPPRSLDEIAVRTLGTSLKRVTSAFASTDIKK